MTDIPDDVVERAIKAYEEIINASPLLPRNRFEYRLAFRAAGRVFVEWEREQAATRIEHSLCDVAEDESVFAALRTYFAARVRSRSTAP